MDPRDLLPWSRRGSQTNEVMDPFTRMQEDMDRMLSSMRSGGFPAPPSLGWRMTEGLAAPNLDISEKDNVIDITLDVPGVDPKDIDVSIDDGVLTVSGKREEEKTAGEDDKTWHRVERYRGQFVRRIALPAGIDENKVEARHDKGVLTIAVPKTAEMQSKQKRIEIKSA